MMRSLIHIFLLIQSVLCGQAIRNHDLSFEADRKANTLVIKDSRTKRAWAADLAHCISDAMMLQIESPLDANVRLSRKDGLIWPEPVWHCSMGTFAYPRRATYRFIDKGGYEKMADLYRDYQKKHGMLKTLTEKANERPAVSRMQGSPVLWAEVSDVGFLKKWRNFGITRAILATEFPGAANRRWSDMGISSTGRGR